MVTVNNHNLCENCFAEINDEPCPFCGFSKQTYRNDPITLWLGSVLNKRYLIGGVIGKGGFGITYLAYDLKLDAKIAVKEYYPMGLALRTPGSTTVSVSNRESEDSFKNGAEKFYNEAKMVARFNGNLNIVSVHDFFYENDTVYFTMGYLQGETLKSYLKHSRLSEGQAVKVMQDITNALMAVHSSNILHRDISPDNIMICDDGSIKLLDFGAARQVMAERSQSLSVILKQGFAPLEQYQKRGKQGPWTDIYALGATIYNALTGELLDDPMTRFENDSGLMESRHGISDGLWEILKKCIMIKIEDRYQDVFELKKDLNALDIQPEPIVDVKPETLVPPAGSMAKSFESTFGKTDPNATELIYDQHTKLTATGGSETVLLGQNSTSSPEPAAPSSGLTAASSPVESIVPEPRSINCEMHTSPESQSMLYDMPASPGSQSMRYDMPASPGSQSMRYDMPASPKPLRQEPRQEASQINSKPHRTYVPVIIVLGAATVLLLGIVIGLLVANPAKEDTGDIKASEEEISEEEITEEKSEEETVSSKAQTEEIEPDDSESDESSDESLEITESEEQNEETAEDEYENEDENDDEEVSADGEERFIGIDYADASSELKAAAVDHATYYASNIYDGVYATAWVDGVEGSAAGQTLVIHLKKKCYVTRLMIYNGYLKTKYRYTINGKVILARIDYDDGHSRECPLNVMDPGMDDVPFDFDEMDPTEIVNDEPIYTDTIRITILSDIPGIKYYDTAISEVEVYGITK